MKTPTETKKQADFRPFLHLMNHQPMNKNRRRKPPFSQFETWLLVAISSASSALTAYIALQ